MLTSGSGFVNIFEVLIFAASESPWRCPARWTSSSTLSIGRCARCRLPAVKSTHQTSLPHILSDLKPQMVGPLMTSSTFGRRRTLSRFEDIMLMDRGCFRMKNETVYHLLQCVLNEPSPLAKNGVYNDKDCWIKDFINICIRINILLSTDWLWDLTAKICDWEIFKRLLQRQHLNRFSVNRNANLTPLIQLRPSVSSFCQGNWAFHSLKLIKFEATENSGPPWA